MRRTLATLAVVLLAACARDPSHVAWDLALEDAVRREDGPRLLELAATAPRPLDAGQARLEAARLVRPADPLVAARLYQDLAATAPRAADRARGHYQLGLLAEDLGRRDAAIAIYRALVRHYPDLMPGERALAHLLRLAREGGDAEVDAHLAWTRSLSETLAHTSLADNLLMQAADEAKRRAERDAPDTFDHPAWRLTSTLYRRVVEDHEGSGLWNDALWELSLLYHRAGDFPAELAALDRILRERADVSLFGQNEHPYFYLGLRRIARIHHVDLDDPAAAARYWLLYAERYPKSILRDDVRFFALCATLRSGDAARAAELESLLVREHPESKYLRRLPVTDPRGASCLPPEVE